MAICQGNEQGANRGSESHSSPSLIPAWCQVTWDYDEQIYVCIFCGTLYDE